MDDAFEVFEKKGNSPKSRAHRTAAKATENEREEDFLLLLSVRGSSLPFLPFLHGISVLGFPLSSRRVEKTTDETTRRGGGKRLEPGRKTQQAELRRVHARDAGKRRSDARPRFKFTLRARRSDPAPSNPRPRPGGEGGRPRPRFETAFFLLCEGQALPTETEPESRRRGPRLEPDAKIKTFFAFRRARYLGKLVKCFG